MKQIKALTLDDVRQIAAAAEQEAIACGWAVSIAVCDAGGHALWLQRMDGAPLMSAQVAPEKARTCVLSGKPSKAFEDMVNNGRFAALAMPVVPLEGGEPIVVDGTIVGAVGVSGVKAGEDAQVARAGVAAILAREGGA
ncbi:heme-binding protein [uncultured Dechloromonas sp.]|uniref:GlcG/HbpS family heme-binding protein n=1 Tax=uncultured Dechloromonas sp. TaxID=171719 RepID=UPI0025FABD43|nr:heme-binding protein [uncultured Dechloromonas sp.]